MFFKKAISDLYIASPPEAATRLLWRHPEQAIPNQAKLTVRSDEVALFFREGQLLGELDTGTHTITSRNIPFIGNAVISPLTGSNHYLTEIIFARKAEHQHVLAHRLLGTFTDTASANLVKIEFSARIGVRITDPMALVNSLGGQSGGSLGSAEQLVDSRLASMAAAIIGQAVQTVPVLSLVSNAFSEQFGQMLVERARSAFAQDGLTLTRFMELQLGLDAQSEALLRDFGKRRADLAIQREGAELALQPGFAAFNLIQGQRAAAEQHGAGLGGATLAALGLSFGLGPTGVASLDPPAPSSLLPAPLQPRLLVANERPTGRWYLRSNSGIEGPYAPRQLALRASSLGIDLELVIVRREQTTDWISGSDEPAICEEFAKRQSKPPALRTDSPGIRLFENALATALADGKLTQDEVALLNGLAVCAGLAKDEPSASAYVLERARSAGCTLP